MDPRTRRVCGHHLKDAGLARIMCCCWSGRDEKRRAVQLLKRRSGGEGDMECNNNPELADQDQQTIKTGGISRRS